MTEAEKQQFVRTLIASVADHVVRAIPHMPEEWDGIELRSYIADQFARETYLNEPSYRRRRRDYHNARATLFGL